MSFRPPLGTIGRICQKSPPRTTVFPPKIFLVACASSNCIKSHRVRSTTSKARRCIIGASSQMIRSTLCTNSATFIYCVMLQVNSSCISIGILNLEWTVLLPKATKMQFLMRQLQAQYCLAFIDGIEALSKQMFCQFHHYHTHRTICHLCLSQHSK